MYTIYVQARPFRLLFYNFVVLLLFPYPLLVALELIVLLAAGAALISLLGLRLAVRLVRGGARMTAGVTR